MNPALHARMRNLALLLLAAACAGEPAAVDASQDDLNDQLGSVEGNGAWGAATACKDMTLPTGLPALKNPAVVVSLDGLTLHLWDQGGTFDKVYPIGPGAIENGKSLTPVGHFTTGPAETTAGATDNPKVVGGSPWAWWYRCKIWWTDPDTHKVQPVYAGLPLIRLKGPPTLGYALHGPIDHYGDANGGALRRGYVSHGCIRMRAEDIKEVYVLLHGHGYVPVTIQRAVERDDNGKAIDLAQRWVGSECGADSDCNFTGGKCHRNPYGRGFCTMACSGSCADLPGEVPTACVADPDGGGMCVRQSTPVNNGCRLYEAMETAHTMRFGRSTAVDACVPGSGGFIGDPCLSSSDCGAGRTCERHGAGPGFCTQPCTSTCPDQGYLTTRCVQSRCVKACDAQDACGAAVATTCQSSGRVLACLP